MTIHVGTSGWVYDHWRGIYYPQDLLQRAWFAHYARDFDTVEINKATIHVPLSKPGPNASPIGAVKNWTSWSISITTLVATLWTMRQR